LRLAGFDLSVEIEEAPAQLAGEQTPGRRLAGTHEAGQDDPVDVFWRFGLGRRIPSGWKSGWHLEGGC
jgi:hypothetical protein